jgi:hypothetical protein
MARMKLEGTQERGHAAGVAEHRITVVCCHGEAQRGQEHRHNHIRIFYPTVQDLATRLKGPSALGRAAGGGEGGGGRVRGVKKQRCTCLKDDLEATAVDDRLLAGNRIGHDGMQVEATVGSIPAP